eukprot:gene8901-biopygen15205
MRSCLNLLRPRDPDRAIRGLRMVWMRRQCCPALQGYPRNRLHELHFACGWLTRDAGGNCPATLEKNSANTSANPRWGARHRRQTAPRELRCSRSPRAAAAAPRRRGAAAAGTASTVGTRPQAWMALLRWWGTAAGRLTRAIAADRCIMVWSWGRLRMRTAARTWEERQHAQRARAARVRRVARRRTALPQRRQWSRPPLRGWAHDGGHPPHLAEPLRCSLQGPCRTGAGMHWMRGQGCATGAYTCPAYNTNPETGEPLKNKCRRLWLTSSRSWLRIIHTDCGAGGRKGDGRQEASGPPQPTRGGGAAHGDRRVEVGNDPGILSMAVCLKHAVAQVGRR